jgi:hypothetical protein
MPKPTRSPLPIIAAAATATAAVVVFLGFPRSSEPVPAPTTLATPTSTVVESSTTSVVSETTAPDTPSSTPATSTPATSAPAPSTTKPRPTTTTTPRPTTTLDPTTPLSQIASRMASELSAAFWTASDDEDPVFTRIWNRATDAGATVRIHPSGLTYTPPSYTSPRYSAAYTVSKNGEIFCVKDPGSGVYAAASGDC